MRVVLAHQHEERVPFAMAWALALRTMPRAADDADDWRAAIHAARPAFRAAYGDPAGLLDFDRDRDAVAA